MSNVPQSSKSLFERFWEKVQTVPGRNACWEWCGASKVDGYGLIMLESHPKVKMGLAHRVAWELAIGEIPDGLFVCHRCDNPRCVRPSHLFLGTHQENMRDCDRKGRRAKGEAAGNTSLTEAQVLEIRRRFVDRGPRKSNAAALAREYGVYTSTIMDIVRRVTWKHLS